MKIQHFALLAALVFVLAAFVPGAIAGPELVPMTFQSPIPPPAEPPLPDLGGLVVGSAQFAPLIWGIVALIKILAEKVGRPLSRDAIIALLIVLGSAAFAVVKMADVNPGLVPLVENLVQIGMLLLGILLPAGGAVLVHRLQREVTRPSYDK